MLPDATRILPSQETAQQLNEQFAAHDTLTFLNRILTVEQGLGRITVVSSFGVESAVLLHLVSCVRPDIAVTFLDTGFHFEETIEYRDELVARLNLTDVRSARVDPLAEKRLDEQRWLHRIDPDRCCQLRKVEVLSRALRGFGGWVSGQKRFQSAQRQLIERVEFDAERSKFKFNPLADWRAEDIENYFVAHDLPRHPLLAEGFRSIGCGPCTTAAGENEHARAGRWRGSDKIECGLHRPGDLIAVSVA